MPLGGLVGRRVGDAGRLGARLTGVDVGAIGGPSQTFTAHARARDRRRRGACEQLRRERLRVRLRGLDAADVVAAGAIAVRRPRPPAGGLALASALSPFCRVVFSSFAIYAASSPRAWLSGGRRCFRLLSVRAPVCARAQGERQRHRARALAAVVPRLPFFRRSRHLILRSTRAALAPVGVMRLPMARGGACLRVYRSALCVVKELEGNTTTS